MTWKEFKEQVEAQGVEDGDTIDHLALDEAELKSGHVAVEWATKPEEDD